MAQGAGNRGRLAAGRASTLRAGRRCTTQNAHNRSPVPPRWTQPPPSQPAAMQAWLIVFPCSPGWQKRTWAWGPARPACSAARQRLTLPWYRCCRQAPLPLVPRRPMLPAGCAGGGCAGGRPCGAAPCHPPRRWPARLLRSRGWCRCCSAARRLLPPAAGCWGRGWRGTLRAAPEPAPRVAGLARLQRRLVGPLRGAAACRATPQKGPAKRPIQRL